MNIMQTSFALLRSQSFRVKIPILSRHVLVAAELRMTVPRKALKYLGTRRAMGRLIMPRLRKFFRKTILVIPSAGTMKDID